MTPRPSQRQRQLQLRPQRQPGNDRSAHRPPAGGGRRSRDQWPEPTQAAGNATRPTSGSSCPGRPASRSVRPQRDDDASGNSPGPARDRHQIRLHVGTDERQHVTDRLEDAVTDRWVVEHGGCERHGHNQQRSERETRSRSRSRRASRRGPRHTASGPPRGNPPRDDSAATRRPARGRGARSSTTTHTQPTSHRESVHGVVGDHVRRSTRKHDRWLLPAPGMCGRPTDAECCRQTAAVPAAERWPSRRLGRAPPRWAARAPSSPPRRRGDEPGHTTTRSVSAGRGRGSSR